MAVGKVVAVLECGDQGYPQMIAAIESAKSSIRLATYIFRTDQVGMQFIDALVAAHRRGVKIRVLIDGFGGGFLRSSAYHRLHRQGVPVARFLHSLLPWKMPFLDLRLHKKALVMDGMTAFVGGLNIGAENVLALRPKSPVRDLHFRVEGTIVQQIEQEFDDDWSFTTGETPTETLRRLRSRRRGRRPRDRFRAGPGGRSAGSRPACRDQLGAALDQDRDALFLAGRATVDRAPIGGFARRGCAYSVAGQKQSSLVAWAAQAHIRPLLQTGCLVWHSSPPFDHSKLMTIDGDWSLVGSANWDMRSLRLNFELTVEFYDTDLPDRWPESSITTAIGRSRWKKSTNAPS